ARLGGARSSTSPTSRARGRERRPVGRLARERPALRRQERLERTVALAARHAEGPPPCLERLSDRRPADEDRHRPQPRALRRRARGRARRLPLPDRAAEGRPGHPAARGLMDPIPFAIAAVSAYLYALGGRRASLRSVSAARRRS